MCLNSAGFAGAACPSLSHLAGHHHYGDIYYPVIPFCALILFTYVTYASGKLEGKVITLLMAEHTSLLAAAWCACSGMPAGKPSCNSSAMPLGGAGEGKGAQAPKQTQGLSSSQLPL